MKRMSEQARRYLELSESDEEMLFGTWQLFRGLGYAEVAPERPARSVHPVSRSVQDSPAPSGVKGGVKGA